jgi:hypothetical protein
MMKIKSKATLNEEKYKVENLEGINLPSFRIVNKT